MVYIRPKISYPFPCVSLTEHHCRHIQAPVMEAILPKLHLNRHSPRAVLFAGPRYGGIGLAENYVDFGYGHLQYLIGHLKMGDEVGHMLLSLITHTQLQVGSCTPFFQLSYPLYAKWIDSTWVTDVWKFTHPTAIIVDIEKHWTPKLLRQFDHPIMDLAMTFNLHAQQLCSINLCLLYLQVLTVSDIATARKGRLTGSAIHGQRHPHQQSTLVWPVIPRPPNSMWHQWRIFLQFLCNGDKLLTPLGAWLSRPHFQWQ
jgi:hypothetical protein